MLKFDKLIIVSGDKYTIRTDKDTNMLSIFNMMIDVNTVIVLVMTNNDDIYTVDLGKLFMDHVYLIEIENVDQLIDTLTPEMIFTYKSNLFNQHRMIRSFMSHDLPGDVVVSPYNIEIDETSNTIFDPSYRDMVIYCDQYDLTKVIPVINGKLKWCGWGGKKIYLRDQVNLVKNTESVTFISFGDTSINTIKLSDLRENDWYVPPNTVIILVLGGSMFYDVRYMYSVERQINKLILNESFITSEFKKHGYESFDELIEDIDSFVIAVNTNRLLIRDVLMLPVMTDSELLQFKCFETEVNDKHVDYICLDNKDYSIHGIAVADDLYENVVTDERPTEHHIYIDRGSGDMRLIQLALC